MSKQFATPDELSEISLILKNLTELGRLLGERGPIVSLGDPTLYDSNGEILGYATWHAGQYVFTLDGKIEERIILTDVRAMYGGFEISFPGEVELKIEHREEDFDLFSNPKIVSPAIMSKVTMEVSPEPKTGNFLFIRKEDNA